MKLSNSERLLLLLLTDIYEKLKIRGEIDPEFIRSAILTDNTWALEWEYAAVFTEREPTPPQVTEVINYLDMWNFVEAAYDQLEENDRTRLVNEAAPFGNDVKFRGFDGNNESEYLGIARFLVEKLHRFERFAGRELNSHGPSVGAYARMFQLFEPIRRQLMGRQLEVDELITILKAMKYPGNE